MSYTDIKEDGSIIIYCEKPYEKLSFKNVTIIKSKIELRNMWEKKDPHKLNEN